MHLTVLLSSFPADFAGAVRQAAALGFTHVDVVGLVERPEADADALADSGLLVSCAALGKGLPEDHVLDAPSSVLRRATLELMKRQVADAARLGATHAYLVPGTDRGADGLARFAEACTLLADHAGQRMVRLCLEHIPGRALATAADTLAWLERLDHPNLTLLVDVGHCLISGEEPADVIRRAGARLGYVHCDDNDGVHDLHQPLLAGRLTEDGLRRLLAALREIRYDGALCLELNAKNPEPAEGVRQGKALLERLVFREPQP